MKRFLIIGVCLLSLAVQASASAPIVVEIRGATFWVDREKVSVADIRETALGEPLREMVLKGPAQSVALAVQALPAAWSSQATLIREIRVLPEGYRLGGKAVDETDLGEALASRHRASARYVLVRDEDLPFHRVAHALEILRKEGIANVSVSAEITSPAPGSP